MNDNIDNPASPEFWKNYPIFTSFWVITVTGEHPEPGTVITAQDIEKGKIVPVKTENFERALEFVKGFEEEKMTLPEELQIKGADPSFEYYSPIKDDLPERSSLTNDEYLQYLRGHIMDKEYLRYLQEHYKKGNLIF